MSVISSLTHHATLFVHPDRKEYTTLLWEELKQASPAHVLYDKTVIDIDTARALKTWANTSYSTKKTALISFHTITIPAQNALLKMLEEPQETSSFILVTSNKEALIPTLYSRLQHKPLTSTVSPDVTAKLFLETPTAERIKLPYIIQLLETKDEEGRKDREGVQHFILMLVSLLREYPEHSAKTLITLQMASYAGDPSSSGKAILEYLSLLLPEIKASCTI
jgi:hypothetical protein